MVRIIKQFDDHFYKLNLHFTCLLNSCKCIGVFFRSQVPLRVQSILKTQNFKPDGILNTFLENVSRFSSLIMGFWTINVRWFFSMKFHYKKNFVIKHRATKGSIMVRGLNLHMNNLDVLVNKCNSRSSLQMTLELIKLGSFIYKKNKRLITMFLSNSLVICRGIHR